jgi:hypothetical protein
MTDELGRTLEGRLNEWLKQPGTFITAAEKQFIKDMLKAAENGVGYRWMQQVIEWEYRKRLAELEQNPETP